MRELHAQTTQGVWQYFCEDDEYFMGAFGVRCVSDEVGPHHRDEPMNGEVDPNDSICLTAVQTPMTVGHRSPRWGENAAFIAEAHESVPALCAEVETLELKLRAIREWCARVDFEQKSEPRGIYEARREGVQAVAHFIDAGGMDRYVEALRRNEAASVQGADAPPDPFPPVPAEYQVPPYKTNQESELR